MKVKNFLFAAFIIDLIFGKMINYVMPDNMNISIPFGLVLNHIIISTKFNGKQELKLVLDTGMPIGGAILFENENASNLDLNYVGQGYVGGAGGEPVSSNIARGVEISIQNCRLIDQQVIVMPMNQNVVTALNVDGIIGYELFNRYIVQINFENKLINLIEYNTTTSSNYGHAVSLDTESIDNIPLPKDVFEIRAGTGAIGDVRGYISRIEKLQLGNYSFANVISTFTSGPLAKGFLKCNGNLGIDLLRRFHVTFDYRNSKMYLSPNRYFNEPFEFNMAGFQFQKTNDGFFKINHVINNSSASEVGMKVNDLIKEINGRPANQFSPNFLNKLLLQERMEMAFKIQREEKTHLFSLRLRRLI